MSNTASKDTKDKDKKVRVFALAKELDLESKDVLVYCKELGFAGINNQLHGLDPEQVEALKARIAKGPKIGTSSTAIPSAIPAKPIVPPTIKTIQTLPKPVAKPAPKAPEPAVAPPAVTTTPVVPVVEVETTPAPTATTATPPATPTVATPEPVTPVVEETPAVAAVAAPVPTVPATPAAPTVPPTPAIPKNVIPNLGGGGMRNLNMGRPTTLTQKPTPPTPQKPATPATPVATTPVAPASETRNPETKPTPTATPAASVVTPPAPPPAATTPPVVTATVPPAPTPAAPPVPPTPPKNVIPPNAGIPTKPSVLNRAPAPPPPKHIAPSRTATGQAPPPNSRSQKDGGGGNAGGGQNQRQQGGGGGAGGTRPPAPNKGANPPKPAPAGQSMKLTPEMIDRLRQASARGQRISINEIQRTPANPGQPGGSGGGARTGEGGTTRTGGSSRPSPARGPVETGGGGGDEEEEKKKGVIGRDSRHKGRTDKGRQSGPRVDRGSVVIGSGGVELVEQQWGSRRGPRAALLRKAMRKPTIIVKEGRIEITLPITVRSLSEAIGMKAGEVSKRLLKETNQLYGNNSPVDFALAELIAVEKNIELVIKRQKTAEEILIEKFEEMQDQVDPEKLRPRPPVVTIMGHVDHGKTSLLDKIRRSNVAAGEVGGITQVIRAWSVTHKIEDPETGEKVIERPITFLDTPGHEAFTKMRARGANVTDIAVIVVAATDGVMPQTEEAVAHARAAEVRIIVAINKVDAPNANVDRTRRQLYNLELLPDNMGGDTQFVETSAITGQGIDDLLSAILIEAELNLADELQADPDRPATGTCLEAYMSADEGVTATVLVQQGTLKLGDIVLCGANYGRVRSMQNDLGISIENAGPSTPVRITGLGGVPNADDPFYVVEELTTAKEIAEAREKKDREAALNRFTPVSLDSFSAAKSKQKITELKVILKAEARGSVEAIRKELEKLTHEEVTTRVLHAGIGAITEADVTLALTSPQDTLIVGFNVTADDAALKLAEARDISLREYQIIYNLVDDVKAALEGRLKPIEEVVHLGRAVVRQTFKVGKVGTIAGCYVTSGTIERSARVRVIRGGIVVYPPADKVVGLDSLKRFKDDAKEVREGFECGLKITGFDDIKTDDVIEAFKIEIRNRTL